MAARAGHTSSKKRPPLRKPQGAKTLVQFDERVDRFVDEYLVNGCNGTKAAIAAGYAPNSAHVQSNRLLKDAKVRVKLDYRRRKLRRKAEVTQEWIVGELLKMAKANLGDFYRFTEDGELVINEEALKDEDATAALSSIDIMSDVLVKGTKKKILSMNAKVRLHDKGKALVDLGKHLGMWPTRLPGEGPNAGDGQPIEIHIKGGLPRK